MKRVGIMGLGNMGEAILRALVGAGLDKGGILSFEIKPARIKAIKESYGVEIVKDAKELVARTDYLVVAVKPQDAKAALAAIGPSMTDSKILISIMAGTTTSTIISMIEKPAKVVRIMPNICISIGEGALGIAANYLLSKDELDSVEAFLKPLGRIVEVTEEQMDAVTALVGSGPAFFLSFLEAMIDGGVRMGLPRDKARDLAIQTIKGTILMLDKEKMHPALMKEMITSPGGTTIAGLVVLDERGVKGNVVRALEAAQNRSRELSK
ncbi:MAG: Pyrroline-5-carboxylate reductase [Syntrophorhabdaceae bacterium PtaU1.Bin034]|nr:MAG: Pyrroline-5-carboxylate reductase [Syntrophorhabdaceae bacterium PtaU1.Bin034]